MPQDPVLPLVFKLHAHVVVDPHHAALCRYGQGPEGAGELVGVKVDGDIVGLLHVRKVEAYELSCRVEGHEGEDARDGAEVLDVQLRREVHVPEALGLRKVQVDLVMRVIEVHQQVHDGFLNPADIQIVLEKCDPFHVPLLSR